MAAVTQGDLVFSGSAAFGAASEYAGISANELAAWGVPEAAQTARDWRLFGLTAKYAGAGIDVYFSGAEIFNGFQTKSFSDVGHGTTSLSVSLLAFAGVIDFPVVVAYGAGDLALQHAYGDYVIKYGEGEGTKVDGGWEGFYRSSMDGREDEIRRQMNLYNIDRDAAEFRWRMTHIKY